jgi:hypothetical protein
VSGKAIVLGLAAFAAIFAAGLWYAQVWAFYERVEGLATVAIAGVAVPVSAYQGIDAASSPLKRRGCFRLDPAAVAGPPAANPAPLTAPYWFACFDAAAIGAALERGEARAVLAAKDESPGIDRIVAIYPDGRAYEWRQVAEGAP